MTAPLDRLILHPNCSHFTEMCTKVKRKRTFIFYSAGAVPLILPTSSSYKPLEIKECLGFFKTRPFSPFKARVTPLSTLQRCAGSGAKKGIQAWHTKCLLLGRQVVAFHPNDPSGHKLFDWNGIVIRMRKDYIFHRGLAGSAARRIYRPQTTCQRYIGRDASPRCPTFSSTVPVRPRLKRRTAIS